MESTVSNTVEIAKKTDVGKLLAWVARARSDDETRYFMAGVFIDVVDGESIAVATDGRRLHYAAIPEDTAEPGTYHYGVSGKDIVLRLMEGQFPNWQRIVPRDNVPIDLNYIAYPWRKGDTGGEDSVSAGVANLIRETGCNFNLQYLFDLGEKAGILYTIGMDINANFADNNNRNNAKAVTFDANDRHAIIMPMPRY